MAKFNPFDPANGYSEEDRVALSGKCSSLINQAYKNPFPGAALRLDAADNAGIFFAKQLAHVKTKAYDKEFPELSGLKIFPQTSDTDEGAAYIEYYSYEPVGFADIIANYASDLPRVDVKGTPHRAEIVNIGDSYGYNVQELRACRRNAVLGIMKSLDSARAEAARRVYDVKVNHLIWNGDAKTGIIGVLSSDNNIPIYTLQNGASGKSDWASKTADEIAADIAGILNYIDTLTQSVEHPDSWVMPNDLYTSLNLRRIDGTGESVLSYIKDHTPQITNWEVAGELSKGNTDYNTTGKNIGLLYTKDAEKMYHDVPMAFLQHAPQDRNLEIVINCEGRDAGMAKAELDAITLTSQSEQKCIDCPVSAGCGWCSGLNYEMYGTANRRFTGICWAHKARVLASAYYHNRRYIEIGDCLPIKAELPKDDALEILPAADYEEFLKIERAALLKFADENGIS